jgi:predicted amidohydrolase
MGFAALALWPLPRSNRDIPKTIQVAGLQLEFPSLPDILAGLDALIRSHPEAELLMLSEYSLEEPPPKALKAWCRRNGKWLVVGGKQPIGSGDSDGLGSTPSASSHTNAAVVGQVAAGNGLRWPRSGAPKERFHNTAFVISPNGAVVFQQAKSRPIQFFADGEPAPSQAVWDSPWGKLGIAICYDASYRQVMDPLIRLGATGLLIPTMDVEHWGEHEHRLNARMAVIRASEYRVPIFRVASSGISQLINPNGQARDRDSSVPRPGPCIGRPTHPRRFSSERSARRLARPRLHRSHGRRDSLARHRLPSKVTNLGHCPRFTPRLARPRLLALAEQIQNIPAP